MVEFQQTAQSLPAENRAITRERIGSVLREDQQVVRSITGCHTTGGKIGFANNYSGIPTNVNYLTIKSWDTSTSAFDITEATDNFTIDGSGNGNNTLASDSNGNQTFDGSQFYTYDGWNRLMTVSHGYRDTSGNLQHGQASVTNSYDAKGRRIIKVVNNTGSWDCTYNYYYNGNQQIEQRNGSNQTIRQNIWGLGYIDNLIQTSLNSDPADQSNCDTPYWVLQDANFNVLGILNSSGVLVERYEYSAYGQRTVYFSPGSNDPFCMAPTVASQRFVATTGTEAYGLCEFGHQGLMHDEECGLVYNRARYLSPGLGRFLQRDPVGYKDSLSFYEYLRSSGVGRIDPMGTCTNGCPGAKVTFGPIEVTDDKTGDTLVDSMKDQLQDELKDIVEDALPEIKGLDALIALAQNGFNKQFTHLYFVGFALPCKCNVPQKSGLISHSMEATKGPDYSSGSYDQYAARSWKTDLDQARNQWSTDFNRWIDGQFPNCKTIGSYHIK